ncbi:Spy/CpxP family protein refolding chaperone [Marinobacterium marinum]|uniref:Signaling pathway modulator ZraP n=1 Tax=Marinobacterium marinum TaxID=2756129 RepID=A0A7W1WY17_9GAMM|nr:periplasmic heavy metal sensor [Marinobacterium marinum]MBA4502204.1 periplasmic heavy metal sensor [Marinobacterium marinum]
MFTRSLGMVSLALALSLPSVASADHHMPVRGDMPHGQGMMPGYGPMMGHGMGMMPGYGSMMGYGMGMMPGSPMMGGMGMMPCPMAGQGGYGIQLDEQQQMKMKQLHEMFWQQHQGQMQEMWKHHNELQKLMMEDIPDRDKVLDAHRKVQQDQHEMLEETLKLRKEMNAVLTDEQRQQMKQMMRQ